MRRENGLLVISLDFELLWGVFDVVDYEKNFYVFINTRKVIPEILNLFSKNNISCTWATVGMVFNNNWDEWQYNIPKDRPTYDNPALSAYDFGNRIKTTKTEKLCFAPELIMKINEVKGQEIGTHTYSHYYCLEPGQTSIQFHSDLNKAVQLASEKSIQLKSLVFPRNQYNKEYLEICRDLGFLNVRTNPSSWYWKDALSNSIFRKITRTGDAYLPFGKSSYSIECLKKREMVNLQKASRFLRPVESNSHLKNLKLKRMASEMETAAKAGEVYHLWWHPHNFGYEPEKSIQDLSAILQHYESLRSKYDFQSVNMSQLGDIMEKQNSFSQLI